MRNAGRATSYSEGTDDVAEIAEEIQRGRLCSTTNVRN